MNIVLARPPADVLAVALRTVGTLSGLTNRHHIALLSNDQGKKALHLAAPHRVFQAKVIADPSWSDPVQSCWRYVILRNDQPIATADIAVSQTDTDETTGAQPQVAQLSDGTYASNLMTALSVVEANTVVKRSYELRCLEIPGMHTRFLWLCPRHEAVGGGKNNLFVLLDGDKAAVEGRGLLGEAEVIRIVRDKRVHLTNAKRS